MEIAECTATLMVYASNSTGIGEHPQHLEEMDKLVNRLTTARDNLKTVQSLQEQVFQQM